MISSRNSPNILLYGQSTNDMSQIIDPIMKQFIKGDLQQSYHNKITYKLSNIHYEFDMSLLNKNGLFDDFINLVKEIIKSNDYFTEYGQKIIIMYNCQDIKKCNQDRLKILIEKYRITTLFILLTDRYDTIINPIRSRCTCIRIPSLSIKDKLYIIRETFTHYQYDFFHEYTKQIIKTLVHQCLEFKTKDDIKNYISCYVSTKQIVKTPQECIMNKILREYQYKPLRITQIKNLKEIAYMIQISNTNIYSVIYNLLTYYFTQSSLSHTKKYNLIHKLSQWDCKFQKSYRELIHIESLLLSIYGIIEL
tara:strand:- start:163 stop:1083 length:921 start_codon:yes stop_codon:yes gene_type:complete